MDSGNRYLLHTEKQTEIEENKEEIATEINNNYKITIKESELNEDRIIVTSGLIDDLYNSIDVEDKKTFIKDNIVVTNGSYINYDPKNKTVEIHLYKSQYFSTWTISNIIKDVLIQLCVLIALQ